MAEFENSQGTGAPPEGENPTEGQTEQYLPKVRNRIDSTGRLGKLFMAAAMFMGAEANAGAQEVAPTKDKPTAGAKLDVEKVKMVKTKQGGVEKWVPAAPITLKHAEHAANHPNKTKTINKVTHWDDGAYEYTEAPGIPVSETVLKGAYILNEKDGEYLVYGDNKVKIENRLPTVEEIQAAETADGDILGAFRKGNEFVLVGKGKLSREGGKILPAYSLPGTKFTDYRDPNQTTLAYPPGLSPREIKEKAKADAASGGGGPMPPPMEPMLVPDKGATVESKKDAIQAAAEAVHKDGFFTITYEIPKNNPTEQLLRSPSILKANGSNLMPVTISTTVQGAGNARILLPCPRNMTGQQNIAGKTFVVSADGKLVPHDASVIFSSTPGGGAINPFTLIEFKGNEGNYTVRTLYWIDQENYPAITEQQTADILGAQTSAVIKKSMQAAFTPNLKDCLHRAQFAREQGMGFVQTVEGYSFFDPKDTEFGGEHTINIANTPQGNVTFDARSENQYYVGPLRKFVATSVGSQHLIPNCPGVKPGTVIPATNGGAYENVRSFSLAQLSVPGFGPDGKVLAGMTPSPEIKKLAQALSTEEIKRKGIPDPVKVAVGGGGE